MWVYRHSGWLLLAIGVIHCAIGLMLSWGILVAWGQSGWWHSIEHSEGVHWERFSALWFQVAGVSWVLLGWLMQKWLERLGALPCLLGWAILAMGLLVAYVLPVSGAWLLVALGLRVACPPRQPPSAA